MDESWRMRMGIPSLQKRQTTAADKIDPLRSSRRHLSTDFDRLAPDDFNDVFGGPPKTLLTRKFSGDFTSSDYFYQEMFRHRQPERGISGDKIGKMLPDFRIPPSKVVEEHSEFYSDIFESKEFRGSRSISKSNSNSMSKSKSASSSVLSSEEFGPFRHFNTGEDVALSSIASKLRPINVPSRWSSLTSAPERHHPKSSSHATFQSNQKSYMHEEYYTGNKQNECLKTSSCQFTRHVASPETVNIAQKSPLSMRDDVQLQSPSSAVSVIYQGPQMKAIFQDDIIVASPKFEDEAEEDEVMSSFVIELDSRRKEESCGAADVDEAIAWVKEKFHASDSGSSTRRPEEWSSSAAKCSAQPTQGCVLYQMPMETETQNWMTEEETQPSELSLEQLDENLIMWSANREANIRSLLSTLHHILSPSSGWIPVPLTNLISSTQVKKAYQKVRLCLHPDKLQQRGATPQEKYVAERAFSILQDAWAAFVSQDMVFG